jgi:hypothetical protein
MLTEEGTKDKITEMYQVGLFPFPVLLFSRGSRSTVSQNVPQAEGFPDHLALQLAQNFYLERELSSIGQCAL